MFDEDTSKRLFGMLYGDAQAVNKNTSIEILAVLYFVDQVDNYIEHRIQTDKVLIEILKDIQGAQLASREMMEKMMEQFWPAAKEFIEENRPGSTKTKIVKDLNNN